MLLPLQGSLGPLGVANATPFDPASISGLKLWLKADAITGLNDGDAVATWLGSGGIANNATQGTASLRPLYKTAIQNSLPAVLFDGIDDLLGYGSSAFSTNGSVFIVFRPTTVSATGYLFVSDNNNSPEILLRVGGSPGELRFWGYDSGIYQWQLNQTITVNQCVIASGFFANNDASFRKNGAGEVTDVSCAITNTGTLSRSIGGYSGIPGYFAGYVMEIVAWDVKLSESDRQSVEAYLNNKWAVY